MLKAVAAGAGSGGGATAVTAAAVLAANQVVVGDDGSRGIKTANATTFINRNGAAAPTAITGSVFQLNGGDTVAAIFEADAYAGSGIFAARRANGTGASPTAVTTLDPLGALNFHGYYVSGGPGYSGVQASITAQATQAWTSAAQGTKLLFQNTPNGSTTLTTILTIDQNAASTFAGTVTGTSLSSTGSTLWATSAGGGDANFVYTKSLALTLGTTGFATDTIVSRKSAGVTSIDTSTAGNSLGSLLLTNITASGTITFGTAALGIVLKRGANGLCGTFVANGVTPVTVSNTNVAITDAIIISLNTVGGTVGANPPDIQTITAGVGFTVAGLTLDTSTYNYAIIKNAA